VWTPSQWQRGVALERLNLQIPVQVVPNPLRDGFIREPVPFPAPPPEPILAWLGRLDELKNWRGFLRLGRRLSGQPHELWLIGRGVDRMAQEVLEEAQSQQVVERLRWFAGVDHKFLPNLLDAVRDSGGVFVSTSRGESFGMAVAEAMARGCAVAVPDNPPFNELVEHGVTGLRYADERAASGAVGRLLQDSSLRDGCGRRARAWVVEQFAPAKVTAILAGALRAAAGGGDGSI
jgi:glycosyltransferase involved in cell wall biosynthesis